MKAVEMKVGIPYKAITQSTDGAIDIGEYMWISQQGQLCLTSNGGAALEESEWKSKKHL